MSEPSPYPIDYTDLRGQPRRAKHEYGVIPPTNPVTPVTVVESDPVLAQLRLRIVSCPHRTPVSTCQCSGSCGMNEGRLVELGDCERCPYLPP